MENPEYMVINPMHMKVFMQSYTLKNGPIKIKEKYVENKRDIKCYYTVFSSINFLLGENVEFI